MKTLLFALSLFFTAFVEANDEPASYQVTISALKTVIKKVAEGQGQVTVIIENQTSEKIFGSFYEGSAILEGVVIGGNQSVSTTLTPLGLGKIIFRPLIPASQDLTLREDHP